MKLSYFSYDFWECCCEAVNAGGWAGVFHRSGLLCVPVGGGPPASRPRCELRSARRLEAWPGPSTAHGHRSQAHPTSESSHAKPLLGLRRSPPALTPLIPEPTRNFACNSPDTTSNLELRSLELQRFQTLLKLLPIELHATFRGQTRNTRQPPRLKPMTPMRVDHCHEMKPPAPLRAPRRTRLKPLTPLLAQKSQLQAVFRPQRCHGFHAPLAKHPQRRCRFHPRRTLRPQPKPRVACAHATRPVAHWPHD